jgi:putative radical SAM enzyme (TIGR03279 family)
MRSERGLEIDSVEKGSAADRAGLKPKDLLLTVNGNRVRDVIDLLFHSCDGPVAFIIERGGETFEAAMESFSCAHSGIIFRQFRVTTCRNNCLFCFVKQLPKGMRRTLYVKDEDYRLSFLYGNYITLCNLKNEDRERIVEQRLTPLYISVHSMNRTIRNRLLGNPRAPEIGKDLRFFADHKIRFNVQIVLCPGFNDGEDLKRTIHSLYKFYPYLLSIAVVPVSLTKHRKQQVSPVSKDDAINALGIIEHLQKRYLKKHGNPVVYASDELYLRADRTLPGIKAYGDLNQIENGVGMLPLFTSKARKVRPPKAPSNHSFVTFTGVSFYPYLKKFAGRLAERDGLRLQVLRVENSFFGPSITVAGLLTGRDVIRSLLGRTEGHSALLVPDVVLNGDEKFLDDITLQDVGEAVGIPVKKIESTPEGLVNAFV